MSSPNTNRKIMLPKMCMKLACRNKEVMSVSGAGIGPVLHWPDVSATGMRPAACSTCASPSGPSVLCADEDDEVDGDEGPHHVRRRRPPERAVILKRHHHRAPFLSAIFARLPEHIARAFAVGVAAGDEQKIGQAIDVFQHLGRTLSPRLSLSSAISRSARRQMRAGEMQIGRRRTAARQHERFQRRKFGVKPVDFVFEPSDLRLRHRKPRAAGTFALAGRAQIGADVEQIVLDARQRGIERERRLRYAAARCRSRH